jgi:hypothetical protein
MQTSESAREIHWRWGRIAIERLAGRIAELSFILPDGSRFEPFAPPPWLGSPDARTITPLLRRLRGEWPCVPFGFDIDREAFGEWPCTFESRALDLPHGYASWNEWAVVEDGDHSVALGINYPPDHPIARLERRVTVDTLAPAVDLVLVIYPRRDCQIPIGLHTVFRLGPEPEGVEIELEGHQEVMTFPGALPGSRLRPGVIGDLRGLPLLDGGPMDGCKVPLSYAAVELVQVLNNSGRASLLYRGEGHRIRFQWDERIFPSLLLWYSNYGHVEPPWNGTHLALGIEPVCAAFDLGATVSGKDNPISCRGTATAVTLQAGVPLKTRYRISAESC